MTAETKERLSVGIVTGSISQNAGGIFQSLAESRLELAKHLEAQVYGIRDSRSIGKSASLQPSAFPVIGPERFGYAPKLLSTLLSNGHDLVHQHGIWMYASIAVRQWSKATHRPTIVSAHGMLDRWAIRNSAWRKRVAYFLYEGRNLRATTCLHALNRSEAESYRTLGLNSPIAVIPNGVTLPGNMRAEVPDWVQNDSRNVLLFLGRIHPKKGLAQLINCWKIVTESYPMIAANWMLVIAGWGSDDHEANLLKRIHENNLQPHVRFVGSVFGASKDNLLRYARAFILPSHSEGLPMAVLEAWSFALPVFMTSSCNLPEGFKTGAAFEIVPDASVMAPLIASMLADEGALRAAGYRGRALVECFFTWPKIAEQFVEVYNWLTRGGSVPAFVERS